MQLITQIEKNSGEIWPIIERLPKTQVKYLIPEVDKNAIFMRLRCELLYLSRQIAHVLPDKDRPPSEFLNWPPDCFSWVGISCASGYGV